jgi:hypothetical protein
MSQVAPLSQVDLYGTTLANQTVSGTFTLTKSGYYKIYFIANGKNTSSSGYNLPLTVTEIWRTS